MGISSKSPLAPCWYHPLSHSSGCGMPEWYIPGSIQRCGQSVEGPKQHHRPNHSFAPPTAEKHIWRFPSIGYLPISWIFWKAESAWIRLQWKFVTTYLDLGRRWYEIRLLIPSFSPNKTFNPSKNWHFKKLHLKKPSCSTVISNLAETPTWVVENIGKQSLLLWCPYCVLTSWTVATHKRYTNQSERVGLRHLCFRICLFPMLKNAIPANSSLQQGVWWNHKSSKNTSSICPILVCVVPFPATSFDMHWVLPFMYKNGDSFKQDPKILPNWMTCI